MILRVTFINWGKDNFYNHKLLSLIVNPRVIKLARSKLESKVEKEIKSEKKKQSVRRRRAAKQNGDVENEVHTVLLIINRSIYYYVDTLIYLLLVHPTVLDKK